MVFLVAPAAAESDRYTSTSGFFEIDIPDGWIPVDGGVHAETAFAPPSGLKNGNIQFGVTASFGNLTTEARGLASPGPLNDVQDFLIDDIPCVSFTSTARGNLKINGAVCQFSVEAEDDDNEDYSFFILGTSPEKDYDDQTKIFWDTVHSLDWSQDVEKPQPK